MRWVSEGAAARSDVRPRCDNDSQHE